jgi:hypothetical protein
LFWKALIIRLLAIATDLAREMIEEAVNNLTQGDFDWKSIYEGAATLVVSGFDPGLNVELLFSAQSRKIRTVILGSKS